MEIAVVAGWPGDQAVVCRAHGTDISRECPLTRREDMCLILRLRCAPLRMTGLFKRELGNHTLAPFAAAAWAWSGLSAPFFSGPFDSSSNSLVWPMCSAPGMSMFGLRTRPR